MKKILNIYILLAILFASCDPMEDIYDKIEDEQPLTNIQQLDYTLTDDDYDELGATYGNFSSSMPAAEYIPELLADKYATLDANSTINVTYYYYQGSLSYLYDLADADSYELSSSDYDSFGTAYGEPGYYNNFAYNMPAEDYLPDFLLGVYPNAESGDLVMVTYEYYDSGASTVNEFYQFDGAQWDVASEGIPDGVEVYVLTDDDYDSMGDPGKYNNFSSSDEPEDYLPKFLELNYPYAQDGDIVAVLYKYYSVSTSTKAIQYTFTNGSWEEYQSTVEKTDQYILTTSGWIFDPTVLYEMVSSDYQTIVDYVSETYGSQYLDSYGTAEYYFGAGSYYSNFDIRDGKFNSDVYSTFEAAISDGIQLGLLPELFDDAVTQVDGVEVYYIITFDTYSGSYVTYSMKFQCTKAGPDAEFEYVEGSITAK